MITISNNELSQLDNVSQFGLSSIDALLSIKKYGHTALVEALKKFWVSVSCLIEILIVSIVSAFSVNLVKMPVF